MPNIQELRDQRAKLVNEARTLLDAAETETRALTAEEEQRYTIIMDDVDKILKTVEREERLQTLEQTLATSQGRTAAQESSGDKTIDIRSTDEYRNAYLAYLRTGQTAETRALQVGTPSEGGYLAPDEFERTLIQAAGDQNIMRSLATTIQTNSGELKIPAVAAHGTAAWTAEEAAYTPSDEAFAQITLNAYKATTLIIVSEELLNDSVFPLESYISTEFGRRLGALEEAAFVAGTGTNRPTGFLSSASAGVTAASATAITSDELLDLYHSLRAPYRSRANWLLNDKTALAIRKLKGTDGQYIWQPGLQAGQPDRLLGRSVFYSENMPTIAASAKAIAFGDFSYYWIADRQQIGVQRLVELYAATGQVGFRVFKRTDGKLILPEAIKLLTMKSA